MLREFNSTLVIIAALNEEKGLGPTLTEIYHSLGKPRCLVVDGRSTDATVMVAEKLGAQVLFQKSLGKGDAIATAIKHVNDADVEYVVFTDADYTYPAEHLPKMIQILQENPDCGMVCGNRFNGQLSSEAMHGAFGLGNRIIAFMHNLLNGVCMTDPLTGLRVVRWDLIKDWWPKSEGFDIEVELNHLVKSKGYRIAEIPIRYRSRLGEKKLKLRHGFTILNRIMKEAIEARLRFMPISQIRPPNKSIMDLDMQKRI